jgi:flagellar protein FlaG
MSMDVGVVAQAAQVSTDGATARPAERTVVKVVQPQRIVTTATPSEVDVYLKAHTQSVRFQVDGETGMTIVNIFNEATGELVQQIPNEVVVRIAQYLLSKYATDTPTVNTTA